MEIKTITLDRANAAQWPEQLSQLLRQCYKATDKNLSVKVSEQSEGRRQAQNRLLWMWNGEIAKHIFDTQGGVFGSEEVHEFIVRKLLPVKAITLRGEVVTMRTETSKLSVKEFSEYLNRLEHYASQHLGAKLTHPDDLYWDALMKEPQPETNSDGM